MIPFGSAPKLRLSPPFVPSFLSVTPEYEQWQWFSPSSGSSWSGRAARAHAHSETCWRRIEDLLRGDSSGSARMAAVDARINRALARAVQRRATKDPGTRGMLKRASVVCHLESEPQKKIELDTEQDSPPRPSVSYGSSGSGARPHERAVAVTTQEALNGYREENDEDRRMLRTTPYTGCQFHQRVRKWNKQEHGVRQVARATEGQLREDKQDLKALEQKTSKGIKEDTRVLSMRTTRTVGRVAFGMTTKAGGLTPSCAPTHDVWWWSTFVVTRCI